MTLSNASRVRHSSHGPARYNPHMADRSKPVLMQADVIGADGVRLMTVRGDTIGVPTERQHVRLTDDQAGRADGLFARIGHWFSPTPAAWRDGFLYDLYPESEIRVWEHIADVVDTLWTEESKVLAKLNRERLARLVVAVSTRIVDIPSRLPDVTDAMVRVAGRGFGGDGAEGGSVVPGAAGRQSRSSLSDRITVDAGMMSGKPCIRGLRYPVDFVLELLDSGMTREEILADYEDLEGGDLDAAVEYASDQGSSRRAQMAVA